MRPETQSDFSGGMVDTAANGVTPANSYLFASNLDLCGGRLVGRPRLETVKYHTFGMEAVHSDGVFRFSDSSFGDCLFYVAHRPLADSFEFDGYLLNAEGVYLAPVRIAFPPLFGHSDGRFYGSETAPLQTPFVFLQVGSAAYAWVTRGGAGYAFRWDGTAAGTPLLGQFTQLSTVYGTGDYVPPARAALFAYGRVFLAVETGATGVFSSAAASAPVDNTGVPRLVFDAAKTDCGLGAADDILGMAALGNGRIAVFKRNSVWLLTGCAGEPSRMVCECADADHGCIGHAAFVTADQGCWFVSDDGIRMIDLSGRALRVPKTVPISDFWKRVVFDAAPSPVASAVVFGDRLLFSIGLDYPGMNAILVYSLSCGCWVGVWSGAGMACAGLVVGDLSTGRQLKLLGDDCTLQALSLTQPMLFGAYWPGRFISRPFLCGQVAREKMFTRASMTLRSCGMDGETPVNLVATIASYDPILAASVTHATGVTYTGVCLPRAFIGRRLRSCSLDFTFTAGFVELFTVGACSSAK
jgi:hypothetical protein